MSNSLGMVVKIVEYIKDRNYYIAESGASDRFAFDPFVFCAIPLSDEEYKNGKGEKLVGAYFFAVDYHVQLWDENDLMHQMVPSENGLYRVDGKPLWGNEDD